MKTDSDSILFDTNILLRRAQIGHPQRALVLQAFERLEKEGVQSVVASQNIAEFWAVATRPVASNGLGFSIEETKEEVEHILSLFPRLPDSDVAFDRWRDLVERYGVQGRPTHDARLVGTMLANGLTRILTFNGADFARYAEVTVETP